MHIDAEIPINIELGEHGLYYGTSPAMKGLLVTGESIEQVMEKAPSAIAEMREAGGDDLCHAAVSASGETSSAQAPLQSGSDREAFVAFPGQYFTCQQDWVNSAQYALTAHPNYRDTQHGDEKGWRGHHFTAMCFDQKGRRCRCGADFQRAEDENAYPVWWVWPDQIWPLLAAAREAQLKSVEDATPSSQHDAADHDTKSKLEEAKEIIRGLEAEFVSVVRIAVEFGRENGAPVEALELEAGIYNPGPNSIVRRARSFLKENGNG